MTTLVFLTVLFAALLHACWNALVKSSGDKLVSMAAVTLGHLPLAIPAILLLPFPSVESLPYLTAGVFLHVGYQFFLLNSYKVGDLTQVYPIARGSSPLIVAVVSIFILGITLKPLELAAVLLIAAGIISISFTKQSLGLKNTQAALLALGTGGFIASYSLVDGTGARLAGSSVAYYAWLSIFNGMLFGAYLVVWKPGTLPKVLTEGRKSFWLGGSASFVAYALVTWAFTQAPITIVTALRETSIIFALVIGVVLLGERLTAAKIIATVITVGGVILLRIA